MVKSVAFLEVVVEGQTTAPRVEEIDVLLPLEIALLLEIEEGDANQPETQQIIDSTARTTLCRGRPRGVQTASGHTAGQRVGAGPMGKQQFLSTPRERRLSSLVWYRGTVRLTSGQEEGSTTAGTQPSHGPMDAQHPPGAGHILEEPTVPSPTIVSAMRTAWASSTTSTTMESSIMIFPAIIRSPSSANKPQNLQVKKSKLLLLACCLSINCIAITYNLQLNLLTYSSS